MSKIHVMDNALANMIAAGEVVERPSSVIKELVENSIDAQSRQIGVFIYDAGRTKIVVEDDGIGMDRDDAVAAFKRHATSKILTTFDLFRIKTLGFRGEALPSIASVSKMTLVTCDGNGAGTSVVSEDDELSVHDAPMRQGTVVTVEELFYNTPARLKYLKSDFTENANSIEIMCRLALAHPEIAMTLYVDDRKNFSTSGRGNLLETIKDIYGLEVAQKMIPFHYSNNDFSVDGFLGKPEMAKANRYFIITLLNGRNVYMPKVQSTIVDSYHDFIPPTRFPFVVLEMTIDPALVDVNVHPSKREVRFSKEGDLRLALLEKIPEALRGKNLVPDVVSTPKMQAVVIEEQLALDFGTVSPKPVLPEVESESLPQVSVFKEPEAVYSEPAHAETQIRSLKALCQLHLTYIVAEDDQGGFYLIDQHAANERINYEKLQRLMNATLTVSEPLIPIVVTLNPSEMALLNSEKMALLESVGLKLEPFGINAYQVRQIPSWAKEYDEQAYVDDILHEALHGDKIDIPKLRTHVIATMSCKRSVKAHDRLSLSEMQYLLDTLLRCDNPHSCPHGRPTIVHFTQYEIEKMFKRTGV